MEIVVILFSVLIWLTFYRCILVIFITALARVWGIMVRDNITRRNYVGANGHFFLALVTLDVFGETYETYIIRMRSRTNMKI